MDWASADYGVWPNWPMAGEIDFLGCSAGAKQRSKGRNVEETIGDIEKPGKNFAKFSGKLINKKKLKIVIFIHKNV